MLYMFGAFRLWLSFMDQSRLAVFLSGRHTILILCLDNTLLMLKVFRWLVPHPAVIFTNYGSRECNDVLCYVGQRIGRPQIWGPLLVVGWEPTRSVSWCYHFTKCSLECVCSSAWWQSFSQMVLTVCTKVDSTDCLFDGDGATSHSDRGLCRLASCVLCDPRSHLVFCNYWWTRKGGGHLSVSVSMVTWLLWCMLFR
jgi:hypothetical protein